MTRHQRPNTSKLRGMAVGVVLGGFACELFIDGTTLPASFAIAVLAWMLSYVTAAVEYNPVRALVLNLPDERGKQ